MDPLSALMGIGSIGAGLFGQSQTNQMQAQMMQQQQGFQEMMSNTAYQRASADMTAAGLNPMMMFSSGSAASTPSGAAPMPSVQSGLNADSIQKGIATATQQKVADATIDNLVAQNAKIKAETLTEGRRPELVGSEIGATDQLGVLRRKQAGLVGAETANTAADLPVHTNRALTAANQERGINNTARKAMDVGSFSGKAVGDTLSPVTDVLNSASKVKRLFDDRWP